MTPPQTRRRSAKMQRYIRTIRVRAEAEKNTNSAAAESQDNCYLPPDVTSGGIFVEFKWKVVLDCGEMQTKFVHSTLEI
jgi:hypothetical protein